MPSKPLEAEWDGDDGDAIGLACAGQNMGKVRAVRPGALVKRLWDSHVASSTHGQAQVGTVLQLACASHRLSQHVAVQKDRLFWEYVQSCRAEVSVTLTDGRVLVGVLMAVDRPQLVFVPCVAAPAVKYLPGM